MDEGQLDQWRDSLRQHLGLGKWQGLTLAGFSLGVMDSRRCALSIAAEKMGVMGKVDSVERRLQGWLDNERIEVAACQRAWMAWLLQSGAIEGQRADVLVDETPLSGHMSVLMVGVAQLLAVRVAGRSGQAHCRTAQAGQSGAAGGLGGDRGRGSGHWHVTR